LSEQNVTFHYVCTLEQAKELVTHFQRFWLTDCGCRLERGTCQRSRTDICLWFHEMTVPWQSPIKEITKAQVDEIFKETQEKHLVTRPFRDETDMKATGGICFCCDDCCGYFLNRAERCDKGSLIEQTDLDICTHCGICVEVCYFDARKMDGNELTINRDECYGCGLCREVCLEDCIQLINRN